VPPVPRLTQARLVGAVLDRYPRTYAQELGARSVGGPAGLYRVLVMAILMSARIRASIAFDASRALFQAGWTSPKRLAQASWEERAKVLNEAGYARYDERTSTMLGETAELLLGCYQGDLRRLRADADADPSRERKLLKQFQGMGDVGVDIFFREVQAAWDELRPFVDRRTRQAASELGLPTGPRRLAELVSEDDLTRFLSGLARVDLDGSYDAVRDAAARA
jgi:hypothetical protein